MSIEEITLEEASKGFAAFDSPQRLKIFRELVKSEPVGLTHGNLQNFCNIPASTLTHHLRILLDSRVISSHRSGRTIWYRADFAAVEALMHYLKANCCAYSETER